MASHENTTSYLNKKISQKITSRLDVPVSQHDVFLRYYAQRLYHEQTHLLHRSANYLTRFCRRLTDIPPFSYGAHAL